MLGDPNYINTIVRRKGKTTGCKCKVIREDGTISSMDMDNRKTRCEGTCERSIFYRSRPLENNLGVGKQIVLPHGDFQVSEPMDQGGSQLRDQLRFLDACHQVMNHQQPEAKDETMEASSTYG